MTEYIKVQLKKFTDSKFEWPEENEEQIKVTINELNQLLTEANKRYYNDVNTILDDATYDKLCDILEKYIEKYPRFKPKSCILDKIEVIDDEASVTKSAKEMSKVKFKHVIPMQSLSKAHSFEDVDKWIKKIQKKINATFSLRAEPKLDGVSAKLIYTNGELHHCVLRGDGTEGYDIVDAVKSVYDQGGSIDGIPFVIGEESVGGEVSDDTPEFVEITGELLVPYEKLSEINSLMLINKVKPYPTPRHAVSGLIGARSLKNVSFRAHGINRIYNHDSEGNEIDHSKNFGETIAWLAKQGIPYCSNDNAFIIYPDDNKYTTVFNYLEIVAKERSKSPVAIDGVVLKVVEKEFRELLGRGRKTPHWAIAYKFPPATGESKLLGVDWNIGRTGIYVPLARFNAVAIGEVWYCFATLHNPAKIKALDLREGDTVIIARRGDVIPAITEVVTEMREPNAKPIEIPTVCKHCGTRLVNTERKLYCANRLCEGRMIEEMLFCTSKDVFDLKKLRFVVGMTEIKNRLILSGLINRPEHFFIALDEKVLWQILPKPETVPEEKWKEKLKDIVDEINAVKLTWSKVLMSLSIPSISKAVVETLERNYDLNQLPKLILKPGGTNMESTQVFKTLEEYLLYNEIKTSIEIFKTLMEQRI